MFGEAYKYNLSFEVFLRYLEAGIQKIDDVRESLFFIPDKVFARILKDANERNLISINFKSRNIFMGIKTKNVIDFIEKYNFIDEFENKVSNDTYEFDKELNDLLNIINFDENKSGMIDALCKTMQYIYKEDYSTEILKFGFKNLIKNTIKTSEVDSTEDMEEEEND